MNALKTTSAVLVAFAMSASAFAGTDLDTRVHELERKVDMISTTTAAGTFGAKTAPARAEPNGKGWFFTLDVLYWQSKVGGAEYAESMPSFTNAIVYEFSTREPKFDWTFAFKAGLGYDFFHDSWDAHAEYTYFRNTGHDKYGVSLPAVIIPRDSDALTVTAGTGRTKAAFATTSSSDLKLRLDDFIVDLGRAFFVSKNLSLRPNVGLKASWITLKQSSRFSGGGIAYSYVVLGSTVHVQGLGNGTVYESLEQKFFGLGPRAGMDSKWHLGNDFSIYGNVTGALLFGYFRRDFTFTYSDLPSNIISSNKKWHRLTPTVDFELGLVYDRYIMCDTQHFSIALGYENQYYWDLSYLSGIPTGVGMYGVNLNLRWDF